MNHNPYTPPKAGIEAVETPDSAAEEKNQGQVLYIAHDMVEQGLVTALLDEAAIDWMVRGTHAIQALGMGGGDFGQLEIQVAAKDMERGRQVLEAGLGDHADELPDELPPEEPAADNSSTLSKAEEDARWQQEQDIKKRLFYAWIFLIPWVGPFAAMISWFNAAEARRLIRTADFPMDGAGKAAFCQVVAGFELAISALFFLLLYNPMNW